jgi:hypothetical protein
MWSCACLTEITEEKMYEYSDFIQEGNFRTLVQISFSEGRLSFVELHVSTTTTVCKARQCEHVFFYLPRFEEEDVTRLIHATVLGKDIAVPVLV